MPQLSLFNPADLAEMRDRTKARNYSPDRDAFRRDHQHRRDHGKARRHAERIYQTFQQSCDSTVPQIPPRPRRVAAPVSSANEGLGGPGVSPSPSQRPAGKPRDPHIDRTNSACQAPPNDKPPTTTGEVRPRPARYVA